VRTPRHEVGAVALLDLPLDDDEQAFRRPVACDDRLGGAEIADVQSRLDFVELAWAQAVERRVRNVERMRQSGLPVWSDFNGSTKPYAIGDRLKRRVGRERRAC
jgi:hypothetical protein